MLASVWQCVCSQCILQHQTYLQTHKNPVVLSVVPDLQETYTLRPQSCYSSGHPQEASANSRLGNIVAVSQDILIGFCRHTPKCNQHLHMRGNRWSWNQEKYIERNHLITVSFTIISVGRSISSHSGNIGISTSCVTQVPSQQTVNPVSISLHPHSSISSNVHYDYYVNISAVIISKTNIQLWVFLVITKFLSWTLFSCLKYLYNSRNILILKWHIWLRTLNSTRDY